jgi:16S rRNA (cytosine967-C5)-methyltransferase
VQDEASQIAVSALGAEKGHRILDLCAAPGGKTFGAAIDAADGEALSLDLHESKTSLIRDGAARLGLSRIAVATADATEAMPALTAQFDRVISDVPCSGLGVLGKKPDMRYADPDRYSALLPMQETILDNAASYVKDGGILLYSTCTLRPEENEMQVEKFLSRHADFSLEPFTVGEISAEKGILTLLPSVHGTDGFFIARMRKES